MDNISFHKHLESTYFVLDTEDKQRNEQWVHIHVGGNGCEAVWWCYNRNAVYAELRGLTMKAVFRLGHGMAQKGPQRSGYIWLRPSGLSWDWEKSMYKGKGWGVVTMKKGLPCRSLYLAELWTGRVNGGQNKGACVFCYAVLTSEVFKQESR